jgi:hypothetical protein
MQWGTYNSQDANEERRWGGAAILPTAFAAVAGNPWILGLPPELLHDLVPVMNLRPRPEEVVLILAGWQPLAQPRTRLSVPTMDGKKLVFEFTLLAAFEKTVAPDETYHLYLVRQVGP